MRDRFMIDKSAGNGGRSASRRVSAVSVRNVRPSPQSVQAILAVMTTKTEGNAMDDRKRWQDMNTDEQAKRISELENRIEALEAKIKARETQETAKGLLTDTGAIG
jgi:uncharacterized Ntn-hydrolase superfamily protein